MDLSIGDSCPEMSAENESARLALSGLDEADGWCCDESLEVGLLAVVDSLLVWRRAEVKNEWKLS